ncbi:MAG: uracil-DNA glycosylase [Christensenellaceae bacterium]|jgi:DNA polymerase|nr:uracil-DNA glycosylase [Christensenellaceae bacterium]
MATHYAWEELYAALPTCSLCGLAGARTHVVPGEGDPQARVMFVGEGPGREEDRTGRPFVGPAGQLLDKMLAAIGLKREEVYIANVVKCRPPGNRVPADHEAAACLPYLRAQFALVRPQIIVCLGATAAKNLYDPNVRITRDRGVWQNKKGVWMLPTYHPAALLRDEGKKKEAWEDMKKLRDKLGELGGT